jgi:hypothetical protein
MRWLIVHPGPAFSVADVHNGWVEALRELGETVVEYPLGDVLSFYDGVHIDKGDGAGLQRALDADQVKQFAADRLAATLYKTRPDVMLAVSAFFTDPRLLDQARNYGTRIVLLHTESPYEDERQLGIAAHADLNLLNDPTNIERFEAVAPTIWAPHAYRPKVHYPGPADPDLLCDFSFVGTGFPSRAEFFEAMNFDDITVKLGGNWMQLAEDSPIRQYVIHQIDWCMDNAEAADLYRSSKIGLNLYRREADADHLIWGVSMGPREIEMAATGLFFLRDPRPEGDEVFPMLPTFVGAEDASEKLHWWLHHDGPREEAARQAREAIVDRTFTAHAKKLLRLFDRQPVTI